MGIFGALTTAVTGMRAQAFALENISGNIANSQTTAFKRVDTSFEDLIPDTSLNAQLAGNVIAQSRTTNTVQGDIQNASVSTFMAINGQGFFVVEKPDSFTNGTPTFSGTQLYSRRGDFQVDSNGYMVNGAGYYLMGIPVDPTTGNAAATVPQTLQFQNGFIPAVPTTVIDYRANLASYPLTTNHDTAVPGSELVKPADFSTPVGTSVVASDNTTFLNETITGGAVTAYDTAGTPVNIQLRWGKMDSASLGAGHTDTWNLFYQTNSAATGAQVQWVNAGTNYTFGANGQLNPAIPTSTLSGVTVDGVALGNIDLVHGTNGMTQFADANGGVQINMLQQNGFPAGQLQSIAISDKGRVQGTYSNGRTLDLAEVTLANFSGANSLQRIDGGAFAATVDSGLPSYSAPGKIIGSSLEGSNTDIADEFTKLIVTQQAYSANTRVITTSNQMVQDLLNMLR
jgi:flagellar hook protein FlgE